MKEVFAVLILSFLFSSLYAQSKPNIVIILSDDHAFQAIGAYGGIGHTPNIDRIAEEGAIFTRAYVANSLCGPSRAALLTGKYSHKNGLKDNTQSKFDHNQDLFVKRLQQGGYQTAWIGKLHLGNNPQGFDYYSILPGQGHYYNPDFINSDGTRERIQGYITDIITDKAEKWLDDREQGKPFCLIIGHKATHRTWLPDTSDFGLYDGYTFPVPDMFFDEYQGRAAAAAQKMSIGRDLILGYDLKMLTPAEADKEHSVNRMNVDQRNKFHAYYTPILLDFKSRDLSEQGLFEWKFQRFIRDYLSTAASMDRNIGRVLDYLDSHQLSDNTLVIYMSDQGFYIGEHGWFDKRFMYEESFRTPLVARFPGVIDAGTEVGGFVMNIDIAPTILDVAGLPVPTEIQGHSMLPLMTQESKSIREILYYHYYENRGHAVSPHFGISDGRYKLIRFYEGVDGWELYDLKRDPQEMRNLYSDPGQKNLIRKMKKRLYQKIKEVEDYEAMDIFAEKI